MTDRELLELVAELEISVHWEDASVEVFHFDAGYIEEAFVYGDGTKLHALRRAITRCVEAIKRTKEAA